MADQRFCLRWNNHQPNLVNVMTGLLNSEMFVDATIAAEGRKIQVHKVVLSACSSYFQMLFNETPCQHPIIIIKDMSYNHLRTLIEFMYYGEVNISQDQLPVILKAAESLQIKGLTEKTMFPFATTRSAETEYSLLSPSAKRKKMHLMKSSSDKSEHASSIEEVPVTEQDNLSTRSQPIQQGQETSKPISSISKQSSSENNATIVHHKPEGWSFLEQLSDCPPHSVYAIPKAKAASKPENKVRKKREPGVRESDRFKEALEAVRVGRMGFCRAAQEYGINNRTLWLEYKKKGYPVHRKVSKRNRTPLVRQPHIRINDCDMAVDATSSMIQNDSNDESEPVIRVLERQCSEPNPSATNILAVPKPTIFKQLSQPSESSPLSRSYYSDDPQPSTSQTNTSESYNGSTRSDHCPLLRSGPALGCSFCWNTIDARGRFLRRKTKYHCPECNINLCLVPCFQEFHEKQIQTEPTDNSTAFHSEFHIKTEDSTE